MLLVFCANNSLVWQIHSDDAGLNWSAPTDITPQVKLPGEGWVATGPANGIVLSSGRVLVPIDTNMAKARITIDYQLVAGSQGRNRQCQTCMGAKGSHMFLFVATVDRPHLPTSTITQHIRRRSSHVRLAIRQLAFGMHICSLSDWLRMT